MRNGKWDMCFGHADIMEREGARSISNAVFGFLNDAAKERNAANFSDADRRSSDAKSRNFEHVEKAESIKSECCGGEAVSLLD